MRASVILPLLLLSIAVHAHELRYTTTQGSAILIEVTAPGEGGLANAPYEIRAGGASTPVQMGWTTATGRIAFAPAEPGTYQVSVFSAGGHGVNFELEVDEAFTLAATEQPFVARHAKSLIGVSVLFGLFGLLMLFYRRTGGQG